MSVILLLQRFAAVAAATGLLWSPLAAAKARDLPGATVESVVAVARRMSPELAAAALDADAAGHKVGAAGALPGPTVTLRAWDVNGRGVGRRWIGAEQTLRLRGKRDLERSAAEAEAGAARHQSRAVGADLIGRVKTAYALYGAAQRAVELSMEFKRRADEALALLRLRYGATPVDQQDVIKAELEAATADADVTRREGDSKSAAARLNALIGHNARAPLAVPQGFRGLKSNLTLASIQTLAAAANPALAATDAQVRSASRAKELTDLNDYPDVAVGANFVQRATGENTGQFLNWFKDLLQYEAKDAEQRAASSKLGAAQARNDAIRIRLDGDVAEARFGLEAVRKAIRIFDRRQPHARLSVETARSGFQAGTTDLAAVLEGERRFPTIELELLRLKVEEQVKYAEFKRLAGGSL